MEQVNIFNSAFAKADFKEKFGRMLQYGARMVSGILTDADAASPSKDRKELIAKVCYCLLYSSVARSTLSNRPSGILGEHSGFSRNCPLRRR